MSMSEIDYYSVIEDLYSIKDYDAHLKYESILKFANTHKISINISNDNNDRNLLYLAGENLDIGCVDFCLKNGCDIDELGNVMKISMQNYAAKPEKTLEFIDNVIKKGADMWDVFHYSLVWSGLLDINKHLLKNYANKNKNNKNNFEIVALNSTFEMIGRFGNFVSLKYVLEHEMLKKFVTMKNLCVVLNEAICVDTYCEIQRYYLIKYLVKDKQIKLDDLKMSKINAFIAAYGKNPTKPVYMPDLFKK